MACIVMACWGSALSEEFCIRHDTTYKFSAQPATLAQVNVGIQSSGPVPEITATYEIRFHFIYHLPCVLCMALFMRQVSREDRCVQDVVYPYGRDPDAGGVCGAQCQRCPYVATAYTIIFYSYGQYSYGQCRWRVWGSVPKIRRRTCR